MALPKPFFRSNFKNAFQIGKNSTCFAINLFVIQHSGRYRPPYKDKPASCKLEQVIVALKQRARRLGSAPDLVLRGYF